MEPVREQDEGHAADHGSIPFGDVEQTDDEAAEAARLAEEAEAAKWHDPEPDQTLEELEAQLAAVSAANHLQNRELKMYADWLSTHKEAQASVDPEGDAAASAVQTQNSSRKSSRRGKSRASSRGVGGATSRSRGAGAWAQTLTSLEKCNIGSKEFDTANHVHEKAIADWEHTLAKLSAETEERKVAGESLDVQTAEALKELAKLDMSKHKLIAGPAIKLTSSRIQRAHEESLKAMVGEIGKLALKSSTARQQTRAIAATLKAKEDGGEDLRMVDFEKLKVLNQDLVEDLEARNKDLQKLKIQTSSLSHKADALHNLIRDSTSVSEKLNKTISTMHNRKTRGDMEYIAVLEDQKGIKISSDQFREKLEKNKVPSVLAYVGMGAEMQETKRQIHNWTHHTKTAAIHAKRAKKEWRQSREALGAISAPARFKYSMQAGEERESLFMMNVDSPGSTYGGIGSPHAGGGGRSLSARATRERRPPGVQLPPIY